MQNPQNLKLTMANPIGGYIGVFVEHEFSDTRKLRGAAHAAESAQRLKRFEHFDQDPVRGFHAALGSIVSVRCFQITLRLVSQCYF